MRYLPVVGLDGREISTRRVLRRVKQRYTATNVAPDAEDLVAVTPDDEWAAFAELPAIVQAYLREVMPVDQSAVMTLREWRSAEQRGASPGDFVRYLEHVSVQYLNNTASVWPTPPPRHRSVPRYQPRDYR